MQVEKWIQTQMQIQMLKYNEMQIHMKKYKYKWRNTAANNWGDQIGWDQGQLCCCSLRNTSGEMKYKYKCKYKYKYKWRNTMKCKLRNTAGNNGVDATGWEQDRWWQCCSLRNTIQYRNAIKHNTLQYKTLYTKLNYTLYNATTMVWVQLKRNRKQRVL